MRQVIQQMIPIRNMRFESDIVGKPKFLGKGFLGKAAAKFSDWAGKRGSLQVERPVEYEDIAYETYHIDPEKTIQELIAKSRHSIEWVLHEQIDLILVGREQMNEFIHTQQLHSPMSFQSTMQFMRNGQFIYHGMKVIVVPWMDGILLLSSEMVKG